MFYCQLRRPGVYCSPLTSNKESVQVSPVILPYKETKNKYLKQNKKDFCFYKKWHYYVCKKNYLHKFMFFLLYGMAHFFWASSFALALLQFELSIQELFKILSPKKQIFQYIWFRSSMISCSHFVAS